MRTLVILLLLALLLPTAQAAAQEPFFSPLPEPVPPVDDLVPTPRPMLLEWPGPVRLTYYHVNVEIDDQIATTHIKQNFFNGTNTPLEGTYIFPLPEQSAISEFNMIVDGQQVEGEIKRKEEARAIYEEIVRRRRDPALLEYVGRDLFQARLFPIPPGGERQIELTYSQVLPIENGLVRYAFPLGRNPLVGGRQSIVDQLAISAVIESSTPLKTIYSPSHPIVVHRETDYRAMAGYEENNASLTSDFQLYFGIDENDIGVSLFSYKPEGKDGFFMMLAAPGVEIDPEQVVARDILLVLDTSGSMQGAKIHQARDALNYVLERLNPQDRFNILTFSTGVRQFEWDLQPVDRIDDARHFASQVYAEGGTNINQALAQALSQTDPSRPTVVIFLTDGLPTQGETDPRTIIGNVRHNADQNVQIFTFGVGDDVNTVLLDTIAQENSGTSAYVRPNESIDEVVSAFYARIATPVLTNLALDFGRVFAEDLYPYPLPDLFAGEQLVLAGRYRQGGPVDVTITGIVNGEAASFTFDDLMLREEGGEPFVARLWATRKIGYLLNEIRLHGSNQELIDAVVALSSRYGIATPYTSFFVPEPTFAGAALDGRVQPLGAPSPTRLRQEVAQGEMAPLESIVELGKSLAQQFQSAAVEMPEAPASGALAVEESEAREALRSADTVAESRAEESGVRHALDKAFVAQGGRWVDTTFTQDVVKQELIFGSPQYFELLASHPEWSAYFAVSPNLIVVLEEIVYVVTDAGETLSGTMIVEDHPANGTAGISDGASMDGAGQTGASDLPSAETVAGQNPLCAGPAAGLGTLLMTCFLIKRRHL
ncbi:MAG: VIT domain-containing protein [Chloroflexota bacterium]|nr:VIT domain-containing protein [Chloroflexota bacterium]